MSRQPWAIKPSEVKRAVNGVLQAGLRVKEVKFGPPGHFSVIPGEAAAPDGTDDLDDELKEFEARHGEARS
jgi:hypothetical protein